MKPVALEKLADRIIRPGIEKHLTPLLAYRGRVTLGRAHRCWNLLLSMKEHEASVADATQRLMMNGEYSQLCLPERPLQNMGLVSFISRLKLNPTVMDLEPGLSEYVDWVGPKYAFQLTPVNPVSHRSRHRGAGGWREVILRPGGREPLLVPADFEEWAAGKSLGDALEHYGHGYPVVRRWFEACGITPRGGGLLLPPEDFYAWAKGKSVNDGMRHFGYSESVVRRWFRDLNIAPERHEARPMLSYPFLIHDRKRPEHDLMRLVNAAVPQYLPPDTRADICQDLIVGILCGDFSQDDLHLPAREMMKRVARMFPTKYGPASLDAMLPGTDNYSLMDTLADDDGRRWDMA